MLHSSTQIIQVHPTTDLEGSGRTSPTPVVAWQGVPPLLKFVSPDFFDLGHWRNELLYGGIVLCYFVFCSHPNPASKQCRPQSSTCPNCGSQKGYPQKNMISIPFAYLYLRKVWLRSSPSRLLVEKINR